MKKINLGEILSKHAPKMQCSETEYHALKDAMRESCHKTLDLAAEEVEQYEIQTIINLKQQII